MTIISYEEQIRGWMAYVAKQKSMSGQIDAYHRLRRHLLNFCKINILEFTDPAAAKFQELKKKKLKVGTMDLKIASIVLVHDAILITRNRSDFEKVPNLEIEDWTKESEESK